MACALPENNLNKPRSRMRALLTTLDA